MPPKLCCIVEGHGEVESVPALIHRICRDKAMDHPVIARPIRWNRQKLVKAGEAERATKLAVKQGDGVLILVDADDDCVAQEGPALLARARAAADGHPVAVTFACREFESWFVTAAECFRGFRGLPEGLVAPANAERIRGAKEWLRSSASANFNYRPTVDQLAFTRRLDLELARRSPSFRRFEREVEVLLGSLAATSQPPDPELAP